MVHATAIVHQGARIGNNVEIGPFSVIGEHVEIGEGTVIGSHCVIEGWTRLGQENRIYQFASIGAAPQDLKFHGEESSLEIGDRNTVREFVTLHRGTQSGGAKTVIGNDNLFMAYSHVAHDCRVGDRVILANGATLAGHVDVGNHAILGGLSAIHQFARVGCHAMISGGAMVTQDVPPYTIAQGDRAKTIGINMVGLKRRGFSEESLQRIKQAYRLTFRAGLRLEDALRRLDDDFSGAEDVRVFADFIRSSERGIAR